MPGEAQTEQSQEPSTPASDTGREATAPAQDANTPAAGESTPDRRETLKSIRDRHADAGNTDASTTGGPVRDANGRFAPKKDAAPPADATKTDDAPGSAGAHAAAKAARADLESAAEVLLADGLFDRDEIAAMAPEKVIERAAKLKARAEAAQSTETATEATGKADASETEAATQQTATETSETPETPRVIAERASAIAKAIDDAIGEDLGEQFAGLGDAIETVVAEQIKAAVDSVHKQYGDLQSTVDGLLGEQMRTELEQAFPSIADDDAWRAVQAKAADLHTKGVSANRQDALRDAAAMMHGMQAGGQAAKARDWTLKLRSQAMDGGASEDAHGHVESANPEAERRANLKRLRSGQDPTTLRRQQGIA